MAFIATRGRGNLPESLMDNTISVTGIGDEMPEEYYSKECRIGVPLTFNLSSGIISRNDKWDLTITLPSGTQVTIAEGSTATSFTYTIPVSEQAYIQDKCWASISIRGNGWKYYNYLGWQKYDWFSSEYPYVCYVPLSFTPTISVGNIAITEGGYGGRAIAGRTKIQIPYTVGHADNRDTVGIETVEGKINNYGNAEVSYAPATPLLYTSAYLPESNDDYIVSLDTNTVKVTDLRSCSTTLSGTVDSLRVFGYSLPSYDSTSSYVTRCDASGKVDGMGGYVKAHIELKCSSIEKTNSIQSVIAILDDTRIFPSRGSIAENYLDFFVQVGVETESSLEITITDNITSNTINFELPKATLPLSLFDDGTGVGTAIGQMATKPGFWCYENLYFKNFESDGTTKMYQLKVDSSGRIYARQATGTVEKAIKVRFKFLATTGEYQPASERFYRVMFNNIEDYTGATFVYGTGSWVEVNLVSGDCFMITDLEYDYSGSGISPMCTVYEGTTVIQQSQYQYQYRTAWITVTDSLDIVVATNDYGYTPVETRKTINVSVSGVNNNYSIWDYGEYHKANNQPLIYKAQDNEKITLSATSQQYATPIYWTAGGTTYNVPKLEDYTVTANVAPVAYFGALTTPTITLSGTTLSVVNTDQTTETFLLYDGDTQLGTFTASHPAKITVTGAVYEGDNEYNTYYRINNTTCYQYAYDGYVDSNGTVTGTTTFNTAETITVFTEMNAKWAWGNEAMVTVNGRTYTLSEMSRYVNYREDIDGYRITVEITGNQTIIVYGQAGGGK